MEHILRPLAVVGAAVVITLLAGWVADQVVRRIGTRHPETPLWGLLGRCRVPVRLVLCAALLRAGYPWAELSPWNAAAVGQVLTLVLIGACAWLAVRVATAVVESTYARYAAGAQDPARVRRVRTQVTLIQRVVTAAVTVVAVAAMLLTFPAMRTAGASLLASAGVIGIVAGIAAQSTLGNLFAGLQIAFGDMVRIGDTVVVEGQWGTVEEITLTYLVVRTWDERRLTMPVSYFTSKPFENWSRGDPRMTGTVFFHLDHAVPVDLMREHLHDILKASLEWDERAWNLVVTDTTPTTVEVRALLTARNADDIWALRCMVREELIAWLRREHPYALPRINTAPAPGPAEVPDREQAPPSSGDMGPGPGTT
ncbi:mechanosensitive ion channel family protein [Streptomyces griseocarneus]|uniref:mechanosensitive ion channel family protein n=1 Tax=Streptomyces griseocarneus TaxID=51201 RepID=UPI00167E6290|nr:mechanosensitive ion channel domain-containing protein [Streptomyces griseocarneus]MBZ6471968.1 mechanosensitive ion channel [Streptomyces griseocarneus]GHG71765.1 mechanosensitive ion channel protein [Streptomyces griseocarneus]